MRFPGYASMIRMLAAIALLLTACSRPGTVKIPDGWLVPAIEFGKWGYIDREGLWRIPAAFKSATLFSDGFAAIRTAEGWGFIDFEGDVRIKPQFSAVGAFKSGLAPVRVGRRWGFIDTSGDWIVEPRYQAASDFHGGRARVEFWDRVCGFSNEDAPEDLFNREYTERHNIPAGSRCGAENSRVGYIDASGNEVIPPHYLDGFDFSEGRAHVVDKTTGRFGYIDSTGKVVLPFQYA